MKLTKQDLLWLFALVIAPFHSGVSAITFFLLLIFNSSLYFFGKKTQPILATRIVSAVFLIYFLYFLTVSWWHTGDLLTSFKTMKGNTPLLFMALYGFFTQKSTHNFSVESLGKWTTNAALLTVFCAGALFYWRFFIIDSFSKLLHSTWQDERLEMFSRNPLMFASLLLALSSLSILGFYHKKRSMNLLSLIVLILGWSVVFFMAQSRGAFLTSIPLIGLILIYTKTSIKTIFYIVLTLILLFLIAYFSFDWFASLINEFVHRISYAIATLSGDSQKIESSTQTRIMMYKYGVIAVTENPWFGYGYGQRFESILPFLSSEYKGFMHGHVHNAFLNHAIAGGIPGLFVFLLLLFLPFILLWKFKPNCIDEKYLAWVIFITMTGIGMTTAILGHYVHSNYYGALIMTLALLISSNRHKDALIKAQSSLIE